MNNWVGGFMQVYELHTEFDKLQKIYGSKNLDSVYGAGCIKNPDVCFIFMNPTGKNVSSCKGWKGLKAPWLGTKNSWKMFNKLGIISDELFGEIYSKRPEHWDCDFSERVYKNIADKKIYITNLGKCTQEDAVHLKDSVFKDYLDLLYKEIAEINPKKIVTFGGQVSSIFLGQPIKISEMRKKSVDKIIGNKKFKVFPVFYPVGQGMRNMPIAIEDILFALKS
jgi:DNA polymerase